MVTMTNAMYASSSYITRYRFVCRLYITAPINLLLCITIIIIKSSSDRDNNYFQYVIQSIAGFAMTLNKIIIRKALPMLAGPFLKPTEEAPS
jgi:hypothetical protein